MGVANLLYKKSCPWLVDFKRTHDLRPSLHHPWSFEYTMQNESLLQESCLPNPFRICSFGQVRAGQPSASLFARCFLTKQVFSLCPRRHARNGSHHLTHNLLRFSSYCFIRVCELGQPIWCKILANTFSTLTLLLHNWADDITNCIFVVPRASTCLQHFKFRLLEVKHQSPPTLGNANTDWITSIKLLVISQKIMICPLLACEFKQQCR